MSAPTSSPFNVRAFSVVRWVLVVPSALVGWYAGLIVALLIYKANEALCPARYLVSGMCTAPWSSVIEELAVIVGGAVVGALVVLLPSLMAPYHRKKIALIAYSLGFACSIYVLMLVPSIWRAVLAAALAGGWMLWRISLSQILPSESKSA